MKKKNYNQYHNYYLDEIYIFKCNDKFKTIIDKQKINNCITADVIKTLKISN